MHDEHRMRMRERVLKTGFDGMADHELLEFLLFYSIPRRNTNDIAHNLLTQFSSLKGVFAAEYQQLLQVNGIGENSALLLKLMDAIGNRLLQAGPKPRRFAKVADAVSYVSDLMRGLKDEHVYTICLDMQFRLLYTECIAIGSLDSVPLYPRNVAAAALKCNAAYVILTHNHPTGSPRPTQQDINKTLEVAKVLAPLNIRLADHIIVAEDRYYSFSAESLIKESYTQEAAYAAQYTTLDD